MQMKPYPGDEKATVILRRADCFFGVANLKALMAGAIMGLEFVEPSKVLDFIEFGEIDQPSFGDKKLAEDFLQVFFGLWNEAALHQEPGNPFAFSKPNPSLSDTDLKSWIAFAHKRESEVGDFLVGLGMSKTPSADEIEDFTAQEVADYLPTNVVKFLTRLKNARVKLEKGKLTDIATLRDLIVSFDENLQRLHPIFVEHIREWRAGGFTDVKEPVIRSEPKVGRNEPCPCGSGKKFKQCCLN